MRAKNAKFEDATPKSGAGADPPCEAGRKAGLPARRAIPGLPERWRPTLRPMALMPGRRGPLVRLAVLIFDVAVLAVLVGAIAIFALAGRDVTAPDWLTERVTARLDAGLPGAVLEIDRLTLRFEQLAPPLLSFHGLRLHRERDGPGGPAGQELLRVPEVQIGLRRRALLAGQVELDALRLTGARLVLQRDAEGRFDLGFGGQARIAAPTSLPDLLDTIDAAFAQPALAPIRSISADAIKLELRDARAGRSWQVENGRITLTQDPGEVRIAVFLTLPGAAQEGPGGDMSLPEAEVIFTALRGSAEGTLGARITAVPATVIAAQSDALAWLAPLDAPVSGALRAEIDSAGRIGAVHGKLEIGAGALRPQAEVPPVPFDAALAYFSYDPARARLQFDEVRLRGPVLAFTGSGHAYVEADRAGLATMPSALVAQITSSELRVNPEGLFARAAGFVEAAADVRITLSPFSVEIGQLVLQRPQAVAESPDQAGGDGEANGDDGGSAEPGARIVASGRIDARPEGWQVALDADVARTSSAEVLALWPVSMAPRTRDWVAQNLARGVLTEMRAALRVLPGEPLRRQITWRFSDTTLAVLPGFPPITDASGFASVVGPAFTLTLENGQMAAPGAGQVDVAGSVFHVADARARPSIARLDLAAAAPIGDLLSLLDRPPLSLLRGVPQGADLVETGAARLKARLEWPMRPGIALADIALAVEARITGVTAARLVPGHVLTADELVLRADNRLLTIGGQAWLSGVALDAVWSRPLGPGTQDAAARVEGSVELSERALRAFGVALPEGAVSGEGRAQAVLELPAGDAPPTFTLRSDLNRVALSVAQLGWSKPAARTGALRVEGTLGPKPEIPVLSIEAPGLLMQGGVRFTEDGRFAALVLDRLRVGGWIDAPVTLSARGQGQPPSVGVTGGRIDLRGLPAGGGAAGGGVGGPIRLSGMRLVISDRISLTGLSGEIAPGRGGLSGAFAARVNGEALLRGQLAPSQGARGTAVRITAADAGAALRAAGLFDRATGGELSLVMRPRAGVGQYDGTLSVTGTRVTSASGLATLLNAISIVGLLDQMSGPGILFSNIDARFRLTPRLLEVTDGSGVGPSLGISMQGVYDMTADRLDMQGVVSPIYVLNSIGQIFSRRGEGLFGFNYRMTGPAREPQVSVNPLSVLTPGMFRELFRRAPPTLSE